jgi:hypothetical protein
MMIALGWFARSKSRKYLGDYAKETDIVGEVKFDIHSITWINGGKEEKVYTSEIIKINLNYNYILGRPFAYLDIIHNGLALLNIFTTSNQSISIKFLIERDQQLNELKPIWKEYYSQGIMIRERMGKDKLNTILFSKNELSFDKMQELKKELNADTFF